MDNPKRLSVGAWSRRGIAALALSAGIASAALAVHAHHVVYYPVDVSITRAVQSASIGWLDLPMQALNALGFPPVVDLVYGGIILLLFVVGLRRESVVTLFDMGTSSGLNHVTKFLVERPRPPEGLVHVEHLIRNPSFPAGHVLNLTALAGFLCYVACTRISSPWGRSALVASFGLLIGLMGLARIHSGEHWPSDVLGGYLLGALSGAAAIGLYEWGPSKLGRRRDLRVGAVSRLR